VQAFLGGFEDDMETFWRGQALVLKTEDTTKSSSIIEYWYNRDLWEFHISAKCLNDLNNASNSSDLDNIEISFESLNTTGNYTLRTALEQRTVDIRSQSKASSGVSRVATSERKYAIEESVWLKSQISERIQTGNSHRLNLQRKVYRTAPSS
jgi:hypothetical protein